MSTLHSELTGDQRSFTHVAGCILEVAASSLYTSGRLRSFLGEDDVSGLEASPFQSWSSQLLVVVVVSHHILYSSTFGNLLPTLYNSAEIAIVSPVREELIFRGLVLQALINRVPLHPKACLTAQAMLFGAAAVSPQLIFT